MKTTQTKYQLLKRILQAEKVNHYSEPSEISDTQAMGILMAHFFEWDGLQILKATYEALEDSNFHTENETIQKMINKLEKI